MKYSEVPDVTLDMIIEAGLIHPDTPVHLLTDDTIQGIINANGSISLRINGEIIIFPYPSGAARAITKTSVNGWLYWIINDNGTLRNLAYFKQKYLSSQL